MGSWLHTLEAGDWQHGLRAAIRKTYVWPYPGGKRWNSHHGGLVTAYLQLMSMPTLVYFIIGIEKLITSLANRWPDFCVVEISFETQPCWGDRLISKPFVVRMIV